MYAASRRVDLLDLAIEAYARAALLYPNSNVLHAQLAWVYYLSADEQQSRSERGKRCNWTNACRTWS